MQKINKQIDELISLVQHFEKMNTTISASNVGWHIEHLCLTMNGISYTVKNSDPQKYHWKFNFFRLIIMNTKKIPRGKAKAPEVVRPKNDYTPESLLEHLNNVKENLKKLNGIHKNSFFPHPYFGEINLLKTIKFLVIHNQHHLKIIKDICR